MGIHTTCCTMYNGGSVQHVVLCTMEDPYNMLYYVQWRIHTTCCTMYNGGSIQHVVLCTMEDPYNMYIVQHVVLCTMEDPYNMLYNVQCNFLHFNSKNVLSI